MEVALLYPQFAPNLYDLSIMLRADRIILQDMETWSRKSRVHRAKIRTPEGTQWINIPVKTEDRKKSINKVRIDNSSDWITPLLRSLAFNYRMSIYYDFYEPDITSAFREATKFTYLQPFILYLWNRFCQLLNISLDYTLASELPRYHSNPAQLADEMSACKVFHEYKSHRYQWQAGTVENADFTHPVYYQHFGGFEPNCCMLDALFQLGPESYHIIDKLKA